MTQDTIDDLSQKQRDRLAYVEFRLWFLGDVCRRDLMERFGIAPAVATRDFTTYRDLAPQNIDFDGRRKVYVPSERFAPVFEHEPEIHQKQVLRVKYHSLKRGAADREVIPHAMVDSGLRWHTRVFDRKSNEFRDLVISRIEAATPVHNAEIQPHEKESADEEWNRQLDLVLVVHPGVDRPEIVQRDFGMRRGELHVTVRAAVAGYVLQQWNVDCSPDRRLDPMIHRLSLKDIQALKDCKSAAIAPGFSYPVAPG